MTTLKAATFLAARPALVFWTFALAHGAVWTLVPLVALPNGLLDALELVAIGRHWQWGYWNHPPLAAWIASSGAALTGGALGGVYVAGQAAVLLCFWAVWRLGVETVGPGPAVLGVLMLEGVRFYGYDTPGFNRNVVQLPLFALAALCLWRALQSGRTRWWVATGAAAGLGLLNKYDMVVLLAPIAAWLLIHPTARRRAGVAGPSLAVGVAALLWMPHIAWLWQHGFTTLDYVRDRTVPRTAIGPLAAHIVHPAAFALGQLAVLIPLLVLAAVLRVGAPRDPAATDDRLARSFLATLSVGPFLLYVAGSVLTGASLTLQWGAPLWSFLGLYLVARWRPAPTEAGRRRFAWAVLAVGVGWVAAFLVQLTVVPSLGGHVPRALFPGAAIARHVTAGWRQVVHAPLPMVAGEKWVAWNVGVYSPDRPDVYMDLDARRSPWASDEDLRRRGGVIVWRLTDGPPTLPDDWAGRFPGAAIQPPATFAAHGPASLPSVRIGWAIVMPGS